MEAEIAGPSVENGGEAYDRPKALGVSAQGQEGLGGLEEEAVKDPAMPAGELAQIGGEGEDDMKIVRGKDPPAARSDPAQLSQALALRAMAVPARVKGLTLEAAAPAAIQMTSESGGSANLDCPHGLQLDCCQQSGLPVGRAMGAKDVCDLERGMPLSPEKAGVHAWPVVGLLWARFVGP
jgi:hypothetical protein